MASSITRIDAHAPPQLPSWRELRSYSDFLRVLVWREVNLRYRDTLVGVAWVFLQPVLLTLVFGFIIPRLMGATTIGIPYALFTYCGLVPWSCFAHSTTRASSSLVDHADLVQNMYFPRILAPLAMTLAALVDLAVSSTLLVPLMLFYRIPLSPRMLAAPLFLILLATINLGLGLILSVMQVTHRDIVFLTQFLIQIGLLITPVWFPLHIFSERIQTLFGLNPMTAVVLGFRWAVLGGPAPPLTMLLLSVCTGVVLLISGLYYFRYHQDSVADVL